VIGSLCSGYGGLDLAVEAVFGQPVAWHCEIEAAPSRVLEAHWPGVPNLRDLTEVDWCSVEPVDILTAGYPCQPFSHAGQRKGADDERHLWPFVAEAVRRIRPRHVVLENVPGHRSLGFDVVLGDLAALRYDVRWTSLRAADVGAPHGRERVFIVASDTSCGSFPRAAAAGDGLRLAAERCDRPAADPAPGGRPDQPIGGDQARQHERAVAGAGGGDSARATAARVHDVGGSAAVLAVAADTDSDGRESVRRVDTLRRDPHRRSGPHTAWGKYEPAIRRWERVLSRVAPPPTEPGPNGGQRLAPRFVEWMMGLPAGWVTDVDGLSRNEMLRMLGNGVVPQHAEAALRALTTAVAA
jgi:DNA (cytosine-5)-methyltransferase 1